MVTDIQGVLGGSDTPGEVDSLALAAVDALSDLDAGVWAHVLDSSNLQLSGGEGAAVLAEQRS